MSHANKTALLSILLLLSVALNVGLLAWVGGKHAAREFGPQRGLAMQSMAAALKDLPTEQRDAAEAILKKYRSQIKENLDTAREQRRAICEMVGAEKPDPDKLKSAFAAMRERMGTVQALNHQMVIELLPYVPAPSRHMLLWRPRGKGDDEKGDRKR